MEDRELIENPIYLSPLWVMYMVDVGYSIQPYFAICHRWLRGPQVSVRNWLWFVRVVVQHI